MDIRMNRKGQESEGVRFITDENAAVLIIFLILLAVLIVLVIPRVSSDSFNNTAFGFGKSVYDMLTGGKT
jgi:hypothetical protein